MFCAVLAATIGAAFFVAFRPVIQLKTAAIAAAICPINYLVVANATAMPSANSCSAGARYGETSAILLLTTCP